MLNRPAFIVGGVRIPFVKSMTTYFDIPAQGLATDTLQALVDKYGLAGKRIGDVSMGGVVIGRNSWNLTREAVLGTTLSPYTPGYNVQRACGTSLETAWHLTLKIMAGQIETGIAGGVDSNSDLPILTSNKLNRKLLELNRQKTFGGRMGILSKMRLGDFKPAIPGMSEPRTGLTMGEHCEKMVQEWGITRQEQDQLAFESHQKGAAAYKSGFYEDLVIPYRGISQDLLLRADTTLEKLAKLKPAFDQTGKGTLTAGNSTALTDGASTVLLASEEECRKNNWKPQAKFVDFETAAVDYVHGDGLLMSPTIAVARMLKRNGMKLQDFDTYEIHEAFAGQVLCTLKAWTDAAYCKKFEIGEPLGTIDRSKLNTRGGSVALGHPFGATGTRIVATLAKELAGKKGSRGLISICTAGGMGVCAIVEGV